MPRSVNSVASRARRKKILKQAKILKEKMFGQLQRMLLALLYAYRDRKTKKNFKSLWIMRINAAAHQHGLTYSEFMFKLKLIKFL